MPTDHTVPQMGVAHPYESTGFLLWRASMAWQRGMRQVLRPHGITVTQFLLLAAGWWLNEAGEEPSQRAIADHAGMDVMMTSEVIRRLESRGLLRRRPSDEDGRALRVTLTGDGERTLAAALEDVKLHNDRFFEQLEAPESFRAVLQIVGVDSSELDTTSVPAG